MSRDVRIAILGDARDYARAVGSAIRDSDRLDGAFGRTARGAGQMAAGVALGAAGVAVAGGVMAMSFVRAAEEAQQISRQTDAVIRSMGAGTWITADGVANLATELSNLTGQDDELIQSGQNVLLTFGQVQNRVGEGNDIFDRATRAALDMSTALGTDMSSAAMQVGKALNDPVRGLAALRRAGIQFTAQQEEQIRAMVEAGDMAGAQRLMLEELERQFGGSAEAQATASQRMSTMWENLQEQLGEKLLPVFEKVVDWAGENLPGAMERAGVWIDRVGEVVGRVVDFVQEHWPRISEIITRVMERAREIIDTVTGYIQGAWATFGDDIIRIASGVWEIVQQVVESAIRIVQGIINVVMGVIRGDWSLVWDGIKGIFTAIWDAITAAARGLLDIFKGVVGGALDALSEMFHNVWQGIYDFVTGIIGGIIDGVQSAIDKMRELMGMEVLGKGQQNMSETTTSNSTLRRFHSGGVIPGPRGMERLAVVQAGETVLPIGQGGGDGQPIQVQVIMDGRAIVDSLVRYRRTNGPIQVLVA